MLSVPPLPLRKGKQTWAQAFTPVREVTQLCWGANNSNSDFSTFYLTFPFSGLSSEPWGCQWFLYGFEVSTLSRHYQKISLYPWTKPIKKSQSNLQTLQDNEEAEQPSEHKQHKVQQWLVSFPSLLWLSIKQTCKILHYYRWICSNACFPLFLSWRVKEKCTFL